MLKEDVVEKFQTYSDYLSSQLTTTDLEYLEDEEMARYGSNINMDIMLCDDIEITQHFLVLNSIVYAI